MEDSKPVWASRTVWIGLIGLLFPLLAAVGWLPPGLSQEQAVDAVMAVLGLLTILFRAQATTTLTVTQDAGR